MDKKINLLYISRTSDLTGAENSLLDLINKIDKNLFNPIVVIPDNNGIFYAKLKSNNIKTLILRMSFISITYNPLRLTYFLLNIIFINFKFIIVLIKYKINIIICNSFQNSLFILLAKIIANKKLIIYIKNILDKRWKKKVRAIICRFFADRVIAVSEKAGEDFLNFYKSSKKMKIIYDGIDYNKFIQNVEIENILEKKLSKKNNYLNIINIGNLSELKGQHLLINSILDSRLKKINFNIFLIGDVYKKNVIDYKNKLIRMIESNSLFEKVYMLGFQTNIKDIIYCSDILVHCPTIDDAFPRVLLEAMSFGKIVIATNVGGIPEIIKDGINGFLCKPEAGSLAQTILYVCKNFKDLIFVRENAIKTIIDKFDINKEISETEILYKNVLKMT